MDFSQLLQYTITGLTTGSIYALIAIGFVTIYNVTGIINFAQGEFSMLGAMFCITFAGMGMPIYAAILLAIIATALIGLFVERVAIMPTKNASFINLIIITIGISIILRAIGLFSFGTYPKSLPPFSQNDPILILGAVLIPQSIWVVSTLFFLLILLYFFFEKTMVGSAFKACVINPKAARLMGINTQSMSALAFILSAAVGAIAGIVIAPVTGATYDMGLMLGLKGFMAMIIGGMTNVQGVVAAGFIIGLIEAFSAGYVSTSYSDAISFAILLLVLFVAPNGIMSKMTGKRV
ncbi:branched-chain amino acid ABC transporter permease [Cytobacillus depressus]|uniref:Branched-chain amino acid ABC transporter permease n=1 Tax=Cytobacillus depressus TaxID=1602942 RepID=A0A6L3V016_9BACI|nr:branched-chain amino acid ABC transporter permease [Cytobacillus depressus]KAB2330451.1 branched-chain amino acid ABC transporter permease [Cytobacillus depressus]